MESHQVMHLLILRVIFFVGDPSKGHRGHSRSPTVFCQYLRSKWDRTWDWCYCVCLRKTHRMMYNVTYLGHRVTLPLTWPEVKLWPWCFKVKLYMVRRALTRQTRWYQNRCSTFNIKDFIVQKPFRKILEFWPLVTSILTWAKKWSKWFRNDFRELSNAVFRFVLRSAEAEINGGGVFKHPPSGGGKSRGPSGRGLIYALCSTHTLILFNFSDK